MNAQEKQQGLNEVVVRKVEKMVTARQENVRAVIGRLHREQELLRDYVVPIGTERATVSIRRPSYRSGTRERLR